MGAMTKHILLRPFLMALILASVLTPRADAQSPAELVAGAQGATLTAADLGSGWSLLNEMSDQMQDPTMGMGFHMAMYQRDDAGPASRGPILVASFVLLSTVALPADVAEEFRGGFFTGFASTSGVPVEAFSEVAGPTVGTRSRWFVADLDDPPLVNHVVFFEGRNSIAVVYGAGIGGRMAQDDVLSLARVVAGRMP
jgi:hypothetical protein